LATERERRRCKRHGTSAADVPTADTRTYLRGSTTAHVLAGVEQDAVELYFVRVPNLRRRRALELLGAVVIDGGAAIVVDYLLKTDV
jgi:hypothetical protein